MSWVESLLGLYFTGDGAYRDNDGHYKITGRVDDVINVKGHRLGTAELESAMVRERGREKKKVMEIIFPYYRIVMIELLRQQSLVILMRHLDKVWYPIVLSSSPSLSLSLSLSL